MFARAVFRKGETARGDLEARNSLLKDTGSKLPGTAGESVLEIHRRKETRNIFRFDIRGKYPQPATALDFREVVKLSCVTQCFSRILKYGLTNLFPKEATALDEPQNWRRAQSPTISSEWLVSETHIVSVQTRILEVLY